MFGADGIYVELAGEAHELRPSLRASMRLVRRHGLPGLFAAVQRFNVTTIADMLREAAIKPQALFETISAQGLRATRAQLTGPLFEFVLAIAGIDPNNSKPTQPNTSKPVSPEETFTRLFGIATGWLGWAPEEAWNATPAEIIAAKYGRTDLIAGLLKAVFGTSDSQPTPETYTAEQLQTIEEQGHDPAFDREGLASLKAKL